MDQRDIQSYGSLEEAEEEADGASTGHGGERLCKATRRARRRCKASMIGRRDGCGDNGDAGDVGGCLY